MFDLEQAIADWRQKMLAAGIETPVPLEELELHLREEMERQVRTGLKAEKAFEVAVQSIGDGHTLKVEFRNAGTMKGRSYQRIYDEVLALFALYTGFITLEMIYGSPYDSPLYAGGSVTAFWMGLFRNGLVRKGFSFINTDADLADHVPAWVIALNVFWVAAILTTLWARRYRPKSGARLTRLLNWALLPALPVGTLVGLFGLGCAQLEKFNKGAKPKRWKLLILTKTSFGQNSGSAIVARISCGLFIGLIGWMFLRFALAAVISAILLPALPFSPPALTPFLPPILTLIFMPIIVATCLTLGAWIVWWAWQLIQGPQMQQAKHPSHV